MRITGLNGYVAGMQLVLRLALGCLSVCVLAAGILEGAVGRAPRSGLGRCRGEMQYPRQIIKRQGEEKESGVG